MLSAGKGLDLGYFGGKTLEDSLNELIENDYPTLRGGERTDARKIEQINGIINVIQLSSKCYTDFI